MEKTIDSYLELGTADDSNYKRAKTRFTLVTHIANPTSMHFMYMYYIKYIFHSSA